MTVIVGLFLLSASCTMVVPVDLPDQEPRLVVNSQMNAGEPVEVRVTLSQPLSVGFHDTFTVIKNAMVVLITDGTQRDTLDFNQGTQTYSRTGINAEAGNKYRLEVAAGGYDAVYAETAVPHPVAIDSLHIEKYVRTGIDGDRESDLRITFTDPGGKKDYYGLLITIEYKDIGGEYELCYTTRDPVLNDGEDILSQIDPDYYCSTVRFRDQLIDGAQYTVIVGISDSYLNEFSAGDIHVELISYTEALYLYMVSASLQFYTVNNPFAEPVIVYNNITNGFGIFAGQSAHKSSIAW